ncbi:MAG: ORF6N domain-containing protein [Desulfobacterales bacterium]
MIQLIPIERIASKIYLIRGIKVMLDRDLAKLYCVETKALKQAVRRNIDRFPDDFMFELNKDEFNNLRSQIVTSSWGGARYFPIQEGSNLSRIFIDAPSPENLECHPRRNSNENIEQRVVCQLL